MIQKDLYTYAITNWSMSPVAELSEDKRTHMPLVKSEAQMYSFDDICLRLGLKQKLPASADGLDVTQRSVRLVEFKSGFRNKITRDNFNEEEARCSKTDEICEDYWGIFAKKRSLEIKELIDSIHIKALESYLTLEKQILPRCQDAEEPVSVTFTAVIDADPVDAMEDVLSGLAKRSKRNTSNSLSRVKQALSRLAGISDTDGNIYCYDRIEVLSVQEYENQLARQSR